MAPKMNLCRHLLPLLWAVSVLSGNTAAAGDDSTTPTTAAVACMVEFVEGYSNIDAFYHELDAQQITYAPRLNMTYTLFKGVSFVLDGANSTSTGNAAQKIENMPMVQTLWQVHLAQDHEQDNPPTTPDGHNKTASASRFLRPRSKIRNAPFSLHDRRQMTNPNSTKTFSPHRMIQADRLHAQGITGKGIRVAVIDSGIDYTHPALGGCFGPGCLVTHGYDWVDGDEDPKDECNGHGTHVAGIIAAQPNPMGFTGAAPGVTLGAYRVGSCAGSLGSEDTVVAAFNRAFDDGSDVINLSGMFEFPWHEHPVAVAVQRITDAGVPVVAAMGNAGESGLWSSGVPAAGHGVAGIANIVNAETPHIHLVAGYRVDNSTKSVPFGWNAGSIPLPTLSLPLRTLGSFHGNITDNIDACQPLAPGTPDLSPFVLLVRDGGCRLDDKTGVIGGRVSQNGKNVILYSLTDATAPNTDPLRKLNLGTVSLAQGEKWLRLLEAGHTVTVDITERASAPRELYQSQNSDTGGLVFPRSSWGLSWELDVKPQFGAPGENIISTYPINHPRSPGGYFVAGGTSQAAPLVAAAYALLLQARGNKVDPATLQNLLSATAKPNIYYDGKETRPGVLAPVAQQGGGLIQAYDAAFAKTLLNVSSLAFNDSDHFNGAVSFSIHNLGTEPVTYLLSHVPAVTVYASEHSFIPSRDPFALADSPLPLAPNASAALLAFGPGSTVSVAPKSSAVVTVRPTPPSGLDPGRLPLYSGFIAINASTGENLSLPYAGIAGSMRAAPVLDAGPGDTSYLCAWSSDLEPIAAGTNVTFRIPKPDLTAPPVNGAPIPDRVDSKLPCHAFQRKVGTALMRVDLVVVELFGNATLATSEVLGVEVAGMVEWYPLIWWPGRGRDIFPFRGVLADGRVVPEGRYRFLARALKIFGDREDVGDWDAVLLGAFELRYEQ